MTIPWKNGVHLHIQKMIFYPQAATLVCSFVLILIILATIYFCKRSARPSSAADPKSSIRTSGFSDRCKSFAAGSKLFLRKHFGIRFFLWKGDEWKNIREDSLQNSMVLVNGVLAIYFAFRWLELYCLKVKSCFSSLFNSEIYIAL